MNTKIIRHNVDYMHGLIIGLACNSPSFEAIHNRLQEAVGTIRVELDKYEREQTEKTQPK